MKTKKPKWLPTPNALGEWVVKYASGAEYKAIVVSSLKDEDGTEVFVARIPALSSHLHIAESLTMQGWNRWRKVE